MVPPLFRRAAECSLSGYLECTDTDFPKDFCCPKNTHCISLDDGSTVLCCPDTSDCTRIQPITCDLSQQNATFIPESVIKTTKLDIPLPECGKRCCPHGYTCTDDEKCSIGRDKAGTLPPEVPSETVTISTPSATHSSTESALPALDDTASGVDNSAITGSGVAVGFFPGLIVGIFAAAAFVYWRKYRALQASSTLPKTHDRKHSDDSLIGSISGPIPISAQDPVRTDFVRRHTPPAADYHGDSEASLLQRTRTRVRSLFSVPRSTDPDPPAVSPIPEQYQTRQTPDIHINGNPSDENTHMPNEQEQGNENLQSGPSRPYSPLRVPDRTLAASRRTTTFTDMLERAGVGGFRTDQGNLFYRVSDTPEPHSRGTGF